MTIRLKVTAEGPDYPVSAQVDLPARGQTFTLSPTGARQLAAHLDRLADMVEQATEYDPVGPTTSLYEGRA